MDRLFFQWNAVYVLDIIQCALIKRIKKASREEFVLILSDNPDYESYELPIDYIYPVALALGSIPASELYELSHYIWINLYFLPFLFKKLLFIGF